MKRYKTTLLGSVAAVFSIGLIQAASAQSLLPAANSYADLLEPVENAQMVLASDDLARDQAPDVQLVQFHHHHHHHHHWVRRYHHHHHHHWVRRYHHHHHYHHGFHILIAPHHHHHHHHHSTL